MEKRYQVFVSSTYADLKNERRQVIQTLMEMDCIPSGMELFPAADEEQWQFIRRVIDDCDYYLLIIGGRYGSTAPDGVSYTEKEYDYALEKGLRVIAFLHEAPDEIAMAKSEVDPVLRERLSIFRKRVATGRLVKFWTKAEELPGLVALNLSKTIKTHPAVGWVRADQVSNATSALAELNEVRKEAERLRQLLAEVQRDESSVISNLAGLDDTILLHGSFFYLHTKHPWKQEISWRSIFALVAPYLHKHPADETVQKLTAESIVGRNNQLATLPSIDDQQFQTVRIQLTALGLIRTTYTKSVAGGMALFWSLTKKGEALLLETRTMRKESPAK